MTKWLQATVSSFKPGYKWLGVVNSLDATKRNSAYNQKYSAEVFCKKKVLLEISQNSQENTCARVFINKETLVQVNFQWILRNF